MKRAALLVFLVLTLLLAACSQGGDTDLTNYEPNPKGYRYSIYTDQYSTSSICMTDLGNVRSDMLKQHYAEIEEKYSCTIELNTTYKKTIVEELIAGNAASVNNIDLVETSLDAVYSLYKGDYLTALQDIPNVDVSSEKWGLTAQKDALTFANGKTYGFFGLWMGVPFPSVSNMLLYNGDLIDRNNVVDPLESYEKDDWTWNTFRDVAMTVTNNVSQSQSQSTYAFATPNSKYFSFIDAAIYSNGGERIASSSGSKLVSGYNSDNVVDALLWVRDLVLTDKVSYDLNMNADNDKLDILALTNFNTVFLATSSHVGAIDASEYPLNALGLNLRWVSFPAGRKVDPTFQTTAYGTKDRFCAVVTNGAKNVADSSVILNSIFDPMGDENENSWKEAINQRYFSSDDYFENYVDLLSKSKNDDSMIFYTINPSINEVLAGVVSGQKSGIQAVQEIESVVNSLLSE